MSATERFIRLNGFLFFLFGFLAVLFRVVQFAILGDPLMEELVISPQFLVFQGYPSILAAAFFILGVTALHLRQAPLVGRLGILIFYFTFLALLLSAGAMWTFAFTAPVLAREAPQLLSSQESGIVRAVLVSLLLGQLGWLLMCILAFRARAIPRWAAGIALASIFFALALTPVAETPFLRVFFNTLLGAGPLAVGWALWKH